MLLDHGNRFYVQGKFLMKLLAIAFAVFALTLIICAIGDGGRGMGDALTLTYHHQYWYVNLIMGLSYLGILLGAMGPVLYFNGLHLIGLGQIALNTGEEKSKTRGGHLGAFDDLPDL